MHQTNLWYMIWDIWTPCNHEIDAITISSFTADGKSIPNWPLENKKKICEVKCSPVSILCRNWFFFQESQTVQLVTESLSREVIANQVHITQALWGKYLLNYLYVHMFQKGNWKVNIPQFFEIFCNWIFLETSLKSFDWILKKL